MSARMIGLAVLALCLGAGPARAADGWSGVLALGGALLPEFEGSTDYRAEPFEFLSLKFGGFSAEIAGPRLKLGYDISDAITAGAVAAYSGSREALPAAAASEVNETVELGGFAKLRFEPGMLNEDRLTMAIMVKTDAGGVHHGTTFSPAISYSFFPWHPVRLSFEAALEFADRNYMSAYFGTAGYAASGGLKEVELGLTGTVMFSEHWGLSGRAEWSRLVGDAARSPVSKANNQFLVGAGLTYRL